VKQLVRERKVLILEKPLRDAWKDFGWKEEEIFQSISKLQIKHFYKHEPYWENPNIEMDYYKARGVNGEDVYTHFHVEDDLLIISSFKRIEESR